MLNRLIMKNTILLGLLLVSQFVFSQSIPKVVSGTLHRIENFKSNYVTVRNIDVWLPDNYSTSKKYAVLYMHDGQMLFDAETTWNKQAWDVDDVLSKLTKEKRIQEVIVVGVASDSQTRHIDYFPQKPFESLAQTQQDSIYNANRSNGQSVFHNGKINSDNYLKFLVEELKPMIDKTYSVYTDQKHTFIAGSSMGGLISMYAICEYPKVFGGAICMSTHWPGIFSLEHNPIPGAFFKYLKKHLPNPKNHKIYFDYGTETLDALYVTLQPQVDEIMQSKGFTATNWMTQKFEDADHSEKSWNKRLSIPMQFLLGN